MAIEDYYNPLIIQRKSIADNGMGGQIETWTDYLNITGLINQASSQEIELAARRDIKTSHKLFCPAGLDITNKDRILYNNKIYRIVSEPRDAVNRGHHYTVFLEYIGGIDNEL